MRVLLIILFLLVVGLTFVGFKYSRAGYESPDYEVKNSDGAFEIRFYPSVMLASTAMENNTDDGFMRLFRYISGANETGQKIAMTTPVFTAHDEDGQRMSFIVPREVVESGIPESTEGDIKIERFEAGSFAAYRFSGRWSKQLFDESTKKLLRWVEEQQLEMIGDPIIANYDPPFLPPPLRRNEVLVRLVD